MKPFILDQKAWHYFSGFIVLLSISSHQHTSQLAHRSPGTEQRTWWVTKVRMHWAYIHLLERVVLTLASRKAPRSQRQQARGHRLRFSSTTPSRMFSYFNREYCRKLSRKGKQCSSPGQGRVCQILVVLCPQCCWPACSHHWAGGEHQWPWWLPHQNGCRPLAKMYFCFFHSVNHRKWNKIKIKLNKEGRIAGKSN